MNSSVLLVVALTGVQDVRAQTPQPETARIGAQAEITFEIEQAIYAVNSPEFEWAERTMWGLEKKMGVRGPDGERLRAPTPDDIKKLSCFWKRECDDYKLAVTFYQQAKEAERAHYNEAIRLARTHYRIKRYDEGPILSGPPWMRNGYMKFNPVFSPAPPGPNGSSDAFTREDGTMFFRPGAFVNVDGKPDPAVLALVLQHEAYHMMLFLEPGHDLRNVPKVEKDLRFLALTREDIYQLKPADWRRLLKDIAGYEYLERQWRLTEKVKGADYYQFPNEFSMDIPEDVGKAISAAIEHDTALFASADQQLDGGDIDGAIESVKKKAESDYIKNLSPESLSQVLRAWKEARELQAGAAEKNQAIVYEKALLELQRCGLEPLRDQQRGLRGIRFTANSPPLQFDLAWGSVTLDQAKVLMMLVRACMDAAMERPVVPCNDGLDIAAQSWHDQSFRDGVTAPGSDGNVRHCLNILQQNLGSRPSQKEFAELADQGVEPLKPLVRKWRKDYERGSGQPDSERRPPRGGEDRGSDGGDRGGHDFGTPPFGVKPPW